MVILFIVFNRTFVCDTMIVTILAVIYITFICWSYGSILFHLLAKLSGDAKPLTQPVSVTCFAGLALIGTLFLAASLVIPAGGIGSHIFLGATSLTWAYRSRVAVSATIRTKLTSYTVAGFAVLLAGLLVILIMHSNLVNHPDTLAYHAQNIEWVKNYPAVPGIAHLNGVYGIQSSWFVLCALFSFTFTGTTALTFVNAAVLIWFLLFVTQKISNAQKKENGTPEVLLWLTLLIVCFCSYTQLRLTATSASPDFIATLYIWLVFYLFTRQSNDRSFYILLVFLSFFSITIKLSALPCVLPALYAWYRYSTSKTITKLILPVITGLWVLTPYLAKNIINTGYILYPSPFPDWFAIDWKIPGTTVAVFQDYIMAYAKTNVSYEADKIAAVKGMNIMEWMPVWWQLRSMADKIILVAVPLFFIASLFLYKRIFAKKNRLLTALIFSLVGIIFWFIQAPDPRFGFGFILPFCGIILYFILNNEARRITLKERLLSFVVTTFSVALFFYAAYRFSAFFALSNIVTPAGIAPVPYMTIDCNGVPLNVPAYTDCGSTPVPCTTNACTGFKPRGKEVKDGFMRSQ